MDSIKKMILFRIPMSICNFRCSYCYLTHRDIQYQGIQPAMKYTPLQVANAFSVKRIGGLAYMNFCADGETLLLKDIDLYVKELVKQGHYAEIVTNMTITPIINKILAWDKELLNHIEFKASFHYLELKKKNLLEEYANNVNNAWLAGASVNIEITPSDDLIPYLDEVKEFSLKHFGALPHITIARDDRTKKIEYLTDLDMEEYDKYWGAFDSGFWRFKKTIFGKRQKGFCYAGKWMLYVDITNGNATQCYCGKNMGDVIKNPDIPLPESPIAICPLEHCYNGHMLLTLGLIPHLTEVGYGDIRNRTKKDGTDWLKPDIRAFFNSKLYQNNVELSALGKRKAKFDRYIGKMNTLYRIISSKIHSKVKKGEENV